jgi:GGDEF domain-containing protein
MIVVAEHPAADLVAALAAAGAFPIIEANWTDAPTAFVSVKPSAVIIAEPGAPPSESSSRMLCLQIATAKGPIVPTIAFTDSGHDPALPIALPADASLPVSHAIARLQSAMRVRALHATVLRRIELAAAQGSTPPELPLSDALDDATVLIAGRGPHYAALSAAMGERVKMVGALSVEGAARLLKSQDIDGIVIGDGFQPRAVDAFLTMLANEPRLRDIPVAVIGMASQNFADSLTHFVCIEDPARLVARMVPLVRMRAFEARLARMLTSLDADGTIDPETSLMTSDAFWRELTEAVADAADRSMSLSIARYSFDGAISDRAALDGARLLTRLTRTIDFSCRDDDGSILVAFTQTNLREAHGVARRIAAELKNAMTAKEALTANVTLATLKAGDTLDSLMQRVLGSRMVAAE